MLDQPVVDLSNGNSFKLGFPHDTFSWLRANAPIFWHEPTDHTPDGEGFWVISHYADIVDILQSPDIFSSERGGLREFGGTQLKDDRGAGYFLNQTDDPQHRRLRKLVNTGFTPRKVKQLEQELRERTRELLRILDSSMSMNFVDVAREIPLQAICMVLGVPQNDRRMLCDIVDHGIETQSDHVVARDSIKELSAYGQDLIDRKRSEPENDILSTIVHATQDKNGQPLSDRELRAFFTLLFLAGSETTRNAITGGLLAFLEHPEQLAIVRSDSSDIKLAIEEVLRWTTPSIYKRRTATKNIQLRDKTIKAGEKLTFWEMSANRDKNVFSDPFDFNVNREPNPHLGFGQGIHFCLGASLARMEMRVVFQELLLRNENWILTEDPVWVPNNRLLGLKSLMIKAVSITG